MDVKAVLFFKKDKDYLEAVEMKIWRRMIKTS